MRGLARIGDLLRVRVDRRRRSPIASWTPLRSKIVPRRAGTVERPRGAGSCARLVEGRRLHRLEPGRRARTRPTKTTAKTATSSRMRRFAWRTGATRSTRAEPDVGRSSTGSASPYLFDAPSPRCARAAAAWRELGLRPACLASRSARRARRRARPSCMLQPEHGDVERDDPRRAAPRRRRSRRRCRATRGLPRAGALGARRGSGRGRLRPRRAARLGCGGGGRHQLAPSPPRGGAPTPRAGSSAISRGEGRTALRVSEAQRRLLAADADRQVGRAGAAARLRARGSA